MNVQSIAKDEAQNVDSERRTELLRAALEVFREHGFRGATLKQIAKVAKISPGLVYWYFRDKEALFVAGIELVAGELISTVIDKGMVTEDPPGVVIERIAYHYMTMFVGSSFPSLPILADIARNEFLRKALVTSGPGRVLALVSEYLKHQQAIGTLPDFDTDLAAELFFGMIGSQLFMDRVFPDLRPRRDPRLVASTVAQVFLGGFRPAGVAEENSATGHEREVKR